jgi:hypothetical protein
VAVWLKRAVRSLPVVVQLPSSVAAVAVVMGDPVNELLNPAKAARIPTEERVKTINRRALKKAA